METGTYYWTTRTGGLYRPVGRLTGYERWSGTAWVEADYFLGWLLDGDPWLDHLTEAEARTRWPEAFPFPAAESAPAAPRS